MAVLELILTLPIFLIALMAVVEFGILVSNEQPLEMATRAGALSATQNVLPTVGSVPPDVLASISRELSNVGIDMYQAINDGLITITLVHNVDPSSSSDLDPPALLVTGTLVCPEPVLPPPPDPDLSPFGRRYVRLNVCVRTDLLTPNLLKTYCLDISTRVTQQTKTYRYAF